MSDQNLFKPCIIIPCYNHAQALVAVIEKLQAFNLPCIVINDGSNKENSDLLNNLPTLYPEVSLINHMHNQGKGMAVISGILAAGTQGYSHCLQIDADGQHNLNDIPQFIAMAQTQPRALISGQPIYDDSVPKSRLYARYATHIWVYIETLSFAIKDSMCGFRVYPVEATQKILLKNKIGTHMDFDTEIMVRLYWQGVSIHFIPTRVIYPESGTSHFKLLQDNIRISWMHTRLFFGMLWRAPVLLFRKTQAQTHWSKTDERKGLWGIRLLLKSYRLFGRSVLSLLMYPAIVYFWLTGSQQKKASEQYLSQLKSHAHANNIPLPDKLSSFQHFHRFGENIFDKLASWMGEITVDDVQLPQSSSYTERVQSKQGTLILCAHLGNIEVCRALGEMGSNTRINALVFTEHAQRFNLALQEVNPRSTVNLIEVSSITPETLILLKEKLDQGEWLAIVGDRTPADDYARVEKNRVIWSSFLGRKAPFPQGPFILAALLGAPVFLMFGLKKAQQYTVYFEEFANPLLLPRKERQTALQKYVDLYAQRLEHYCLMAPLDWFNFYDFWQLHAQDESDTIND